MADELTKPRSSLTDPKPSASEEKKLEPPANVKPAKTRKRSGMEKFASNFVNEDAKNIKSYIFGEVIIPAIKKLIYEGVSNTLDMILYGSVGHSRDRDRRGGSSITYKSYSSIYDDRDRRERRRSYDDYDLDEDPIFETRGDAELVLDELDNALDRYKILSVADFKDICRMRSNYTDNRYGWTNINSAKVVHIRDGWTIRMPKAMPIE